MFFALKIALSVGDGNFDWGQFLAATGREPVPFEAFTPVRSLVSKEHDPLLQEQHGGMTKPDFFHRYGPETEQDSAMGVPSTLRAFN